VATIGSVVSILAEPFDSFTLLIIGRLLEALGSSAGLVIAYTIINDYYYPVDARRMISFMALAFAVTPGLATMMGSLLIAHFQWISCFYFMLIYGLTLIIPVCFLTETATKLDFDALHARAIKSHYQTVASNRLLRDASFILSLTTMCIYVFASSAPLIAIHYLGVPAETYAFVGLIPFIGTGLGSLCSALLNKRFSAHALIKFGFIMELIATLTLVGFFAMHIINMQVLIGTGFLFMFGGCLMSANLAGIASCCVEDKAHGSAVMNFINIGTAVAGTFVLALTPGTQAFKMPILFLCALVFMLFIRAWHRLYR
jgi:MFS family permease